MNYKITKYKQRSIETENGDVEKVIRVWYESGTGYKGSMDFKKERFSAEKAKKAIEKELLQLEVLEKK